MRSGSMWPIESQISLTRAGYLARQAVEVSNDSHRERRLPGSAPRRPAAPTERLRCSRSDPITSSRMWSIISWRNLLLGLVTVDGDTSGSNASSPSHQAGERGTLEHAPCHQPRRRAGATAIELTCTGASTAIVSATMHRRQDDERLGDIATMIEELQDSTTLTGSSG